MPRWGCSPCVCKLAYLWKGTAPLTSGAGDGGSRWIVFSSAHARSRQLGHVPKHFPRPQAEF